MRLSIEKTWEDYDGMLSTSWQVSNNEFCTTQERVYTYPETILSFAKALQNFPSSVKDEVCFGEDFDTNKNANICGLFHLKAHVYNGVGHCALEVKAKSDGSKPYCFNTNFSILCEPTTFNSIGLAIESWLFDTSSPLILEY
jgi:hypothetical protein